MESRLRINCGCAKVLVIRLEQAWNRPMHLLWKRIERLIQELLQRDTMPSEERFGAILLAMDAAGLPRDAAQVAKMRKFWQEAVDTRRGGRKIS